MKEEDADKKDDKKTITINPALFQLTKSKKKSSGKKRLVPKHHNMTVRKGSRFKSGTVLNYFRKTQNECLKNLDLRDAEEDEIKSATETAEEESEFDKSVKILKSVCKMAKYEKEEEEAPPSGMQEVQLLDTFPTMSNTTGEVGSSPPVVQILPVPPYGVLKNGKLPTYREYVRNKTFNQHHPIPTTAVYSSIAPPSPMHAPAPPALIQVPPPNFTYPTAPINVVTGLPMNMEGYSDGMSVVAPASSYAISLPPPPPPPQKKLKRTTYKFHTGKIPEKGICSILVLNQTSKEKIIKNTQSLKQSNIKEIKKYLLKRDLIKAGTTAPNDVLRTMYETANLICGDVENHDNDILLHNFLCEEK